VGHGIAKAKIRIQPLYGAVDKLGEVDLEEVVPPKSTKTPLRRLTGFRQALTEPNERVVSRAKGFEAHEVVTD
jgi:hypothetical protein